MPQDSLDVDGTVTALSISQIKGEKKSNIPSAQFFAGHGIDGDAHAGDWHRQVSLLGTESIAKIIAAGMDVHPGYLPPEWPSSKWRPFQFVDPRLVLSDDIIGGRLVP